MKKLLLLFAMITTLLGAVSCSDKEPETSSFIVGFAQNTFVMNNATGSTTTVRIVSSKPAEANLVIPFSLTGEGVDELALSANQFEFKAGASEAEITIIRKTVSKPKNATITLSATKGVRLGLMDYAQISLLGPNVYSFAHNHDKLGMAKSYEVMLETGTGEKFSFPDTTALDIIVDDASTAVENVDFKFENGRKAIFPTGKHVGKIAIKFLKKREGHDKLVLSLAKSESLIAGNNPTLTINIMGDSDLSGTWTYAEVVNKNWWEKQWEISPDILVDGKPEADEFTLKSDGKNYKFTPNFTGKLRNYFTGAGKATHMGTRPERLQEVSVRAPKVDITVLRIDNINLNISPTDKIIGSYRVGFFMRNNDKTGEEELVMTIYEYKPTSTIPGPGGNTWKDVYDTMAFDKNDPIMLYAPIRITFTRKK